MKIVLDANIFISAFFWGGKPQQVMERVISGIDELYITKEIMDEIEDVIRRPKFQANKDMVNYFLTSIEEIGNKITPQKLQSNGSRDRKDNIYIECGIAANADYIISGDIHLLEMGKYGKIRISSARDYLSILA